MRFFFFFTGTAPGSSVVVVVFFRFSCVDKSKVERAVFFGRQLCESLFFFFFRPAFIIFLFLGGWGSECV
jgi:hypothetical protein